MSLNVLLTRIMNDVAFFKNNFYIYQNIEILVVVTFH